MTTKRKPSAAVILIGASGWVVSLFLGILDLPEKITSFTRHAPTAKTAVQDWLNLDTDYSGQWTSSVEDWVDATEEEQKLSNTAGGPVRLRLKVYGGKVEGEMETAGLKNGYLFNNLLLEGTKINGSLNVWAYDYINGKKHGFAELDLRLSDDERLPLVLEVLKGGLYMPFKAKLYRTTADTSEPIYRETNLELVQQMLKGTQAPVDIPEPSSK